MVMRQGTKSVTRRVRTVPLFLSLLMLSACYNAEPQTAGTVEFDQACSFNGARCGHLTRLIDPARIVAGTIRIGFLLYPHSDATKPAVGTIVATEGGPGYPTSGTGEAYQELFKPLLTDHDLLLVDNRGNDLSAPIDCDELRTMPTPTIEAVGACGRGLSLRGGTFAIERADDRVHGTLDGVRRTEDLPASGAIDPDRRTGDVHAELTLAGAEQGNVSVQWNAKADVPRADRRHGRRAALPCLDAGALTGRQRTNSKFAQQRG